MESEVRFLRGLRMQRFSSIAVGDIGSGLSSLNDEQTSMEIYE
jgi:hypothetical protein